MKQKYPTKKGTFGLNTGLCNLFEFLTNLGIRVIHVILTKPVSDATIPATDFYTNEKYQNKSMWIGTEFTDEILSTDTSIAPSETSIFTSTKLSYFNIMPQNFSKLKFFGENKEGVLIELLNGELNKLSDIDEIPTMN